MPSSSEDASSIEEIQVTEVATPPPETPLEEFETERILSEEEIEAIAAHEKYMWENYYRPQHEEKMKSWHDAQVAMLQDPEYWEDRRCELLQRRQQYHKKGAWSPEVFHEVEYLDKEIQQCEDMMDMLDGFEKEIPTGNPILGGLDWWRDGLPLETDGWVSTK